MFVCQRQQQLLDALTLAECPADLMSYAWMISQFNMIKSKPDIYVTTPVPK